MRGRAGSIAVAWASTLEAASRRFANGEKRDICSFQLQLCHAGGRVVLSSGVAVEYDWLVLALGADSVFFGIEGVKEHCVPFCTYQDAVKVPAFDNPGLLSAMSLSIHSEVLSMCDS